MNKNRIISELLGCRDTLRTVGMWIEDLEKQIASKPTKAKANPAIARKRKAA